MKPLTNRERDVMILHQRLMADGVAPGELIGRIAETLNAAPNSVAVHRQLLKQRGYLDFGKRGTRRGETRILRRIPDYELEYERLRKAALNSKDARLREHASLMPAWEER